MCLCVCKFVPIPWARVQLIPEFYYLPETFWNNNRVHLGEKQSGTPLDDVVLPPWAHGDPVTFIRIMREALEHEYVSAKLDEWVDLVFGYKQRGPAAEEVRRGRVERVWGGGSQGSSPLGVIGKGVIAQCPRPTQGLALS